MKVYCKIKRLYKNIEYLHRYAEASDATISFLMKPQLNTFFLNEALKHQRVYSTFAHKSWINIYGTEGVQVIDVLDNREGISLEEAEQVKKKDVAIVNAYCCCNKQTTLKKVNDAYWRLKDTGWSKVSMGGTVLLHQDLILTDELRVGEGMLTGHLSGIRVDAIKDLANPFYIDVPVWKSGKHGTVIKKGFCELGGFTDCDVICNNTEIMVLDMQTDKKYVRLQPDYYSLIKLGHNGMLSNVEII